MTYESRSKSESFLESLKVYSNLLRVSFYLSSGELTIYVRKGANIVSHMGLMPEIDRAWISIDNKLFLWDYNEG